MQDIDTTKLDYNDLIRYAKQERARFIGDVASKFFKKLGGFIGKIKKSLDHTAKTCEQRYLEGAQDIHDLERRMRNLERKRALYSC